MPVPLRIAIVGGGVAGITAAHVLSRAHRVTLFEKNDYLGGHTRTIVIPSGPDSGLPIDTGFIVLNDRTYPLFHRLLSQLGVPVRYADMSFSVVCEQSGLQYGSRNFSALFAQRRNLLNPRFVGMLVELPRFWRVARRALDEDSLSNQTLQEFIDARRFPASLADDYLYPLGAAIWSSPRQSLEVFPAKTFLQFFSNHGFLSYGFQPRWQTVEGGSFQYVRAFERSFSGEIQLNAMIKSVARPNGVPTVHLDGGVTRSFDRIILAAHADESIALLADPSAAEKETIGKWSYFVNQAYLHTDESFLPSAVRARASWNYRKELGEDGTQSVSITYHMNNLQGVRGSHEYCVTLNPRRPIASDKVIKVIEYTHPYLNGETVATQPLVRAMNGERNTWYCGSYLGYGFHEDAVRSAVDVAESFGLSL